jgi:D-beta-D-heptose 7-phosphate kinase/D-beta-D-heptose 1-phosphate adenosyltransferase
MRLSAEAFNACRVLVLGDLVLDLFVYGEIERISPEAPVPVLRARSSKYSPGGAANVAANIAALGAKPTLIGVVGADQGAAELAAAIGGEQKGIAFRPVADKSRRTIMKTRYIAGAQQVVRVDHEDTAAIEGAVEDDVLAAFEAALPHCDVVIISDYAKGLFTDRVLRGAIDKARRAGRPVLVDPKRTRLADYRGATIIKPNRKELKAATGLPCNQDEEAERAASQVIAETDAMILLTRSEQGMSLFRAHHAPVHARAEAREISDVSGAGDTVIAVLAVALAAGMEVEAAIGVANAAAGIVVGKLGTATVQIAELNRELETSDRGFRNRILDWDAAQRQREEWRKQGLLVGFANGCFDLIHPGHIALLAQARASCDRLIVALNSDDSIKRLKGPDRPLQNEQARAFVMASIEHVDAVTLFDEDTPLELIETIKPDVLIKGSDYREDQVVGGDLVKSWGGRVVLADLVPNQSTTSIVKRSR